MEFIKNIKIGNKNYKYEIKFIEKDYWGEKVKEILCCLDNNNNSYTYALSDDRWEIRYAKLQFDKLVEGQEFKNLEEFEKTSINFRIFDRHKIADREQYLSVDAKVFTDAEDIVKFLLCA